MTLGDDLTKEEIATLPLEMRCCYFLYPWNNRMVATSVKGWARNIGFCAHTADDTIYSQSVNIAEHEANELIRFVKETHVNAPNYTHELTQFSWKFKELDDHTKDRDDRTDGLEQKLYLHIDSEKAMHNVLKSAFGDLHRRMDKVEHDDTSTSHESMVVGNLRNTNVRLHKTIDERDEQIKDIKAEVKELERCRNNQRVSITGLVVRNNELVDHVNELEFRLGARQKRINDPEAEVEKLRMKIFDIEGREDLVTAELEHQISDLEAEVSRQQSMIDWRDSEIKDMKLRVDRKSLINSDKQYIKTLEAKIAQQGSHIRSMFNLMDDRNECIEELEKQNHALATEIVHKRTRIDEGACAVVELEEMQKADTNAWKKRESELLQMVADRDQDIDTICSDCELLDVILEIINPIIRSGEFAHPAQSGISLSQGMWDVCHCVIDFRRKHNIAG